MSTSAFSVDSELLRYESYDALQISYSVNPFFLVFQAFSLYRFYLSVHLVLALLCRPFVLPVPPPSSLLWWDLSSPCLRSDPLVNYHACSILQSYHCRMQIVYHAHAVELYTNAIWNKLFVFLFEHFRQLLIIQIKKKRPSRACHMQCAILV